MAKSSSKNTSMTARERSKFRIRRKISGTDDCARVSVFRSDRYTYAQVISDVSHRTLASGSTREEDILKGAPSADSEIAGAGSSRSAKSVRAAFALGVSLGERMKEKGLSKVVFDRNGLPYHGRVRAVAEGLRSAGIQV
jgi:large subunit ribosomal protein L18